MYVYYMIGVILKRYQVHEFNYGTGNFTIVQYRNIVPRSIMCKKDMSTVIHWKYKT